MATERLLLLISSGILTAFSVAPGLAAQSTPASALPPTPPTQNAPSTITAPLAAVATSADRPGAPRHHAEVSCTGGMLEVHAQNSSLNGILRSISRCTGMKITGGVPEQRVYGDYGPAAPATVLATLIDGTGSNMLLHETGTDQPAELILSPRTGGPTPPSPSTYADADTPDSSSAPTGAPAQGNPMPPDMHLPRRTQTAMDMVHANGTPVPQPNAGSAVTSPQPIPQPYNNVNGSPSNSSPTASTYPTTNSVPLDSIRTPSTTPSTDGIVDAPNPPPAGSDTAAAMHGAPASQPGTTNISPDATSNTSTPGATNTTVPATTARPGTELTPEQIFQQLQQRQQQQQQQQQQQNNPQ